MNAASQEILFAKVKTKYRGMTSRWHSGYVAGVCEAALDRPPQDFPDDADTDYVEGYENGYLDYAGEDALVLFPGTVHTPDDLDPVWWERDGE